MRLILSRKGFDSTSGGCPSPIFPDGRMVSLPIPDRQSPITYGDIAWEEPGIGKLVDDLSGGRISPSQGAHLDPDLVDGSLPRADGWRPLLGQAGAAQGHLQKCGVSPGDVFLFFGLFRDVLVDGGGFVWDGSAAARHVIWGWLQVGEVVPVDGCDSTRYGWAAYHPHFGRRPDPNNTIYVARLRLDLPGLSGHHPGAGVFRSFSPALQLTAKGSASVCLWELPGWAHPRAGRPPLSYHRKIGRWRRLGDRVRLNAVARGQEFVLDCDYYPEALWWLKELLRSSGRDGAPDTGGRAGRTPTTPRYL